MIRKITRNHYLISKGHRMQFLSSQMETLYNKSIFVILLLLHLHVNTITAERICHQCFGINCLRTSYEATQKCLNDLDICVTIFEGQTLIAQGCLEQISADLRNKCSDEKSSECLKCSENLCNNLASNSFECIQCDSNADNNCRSNPLSLLPTRCAVSHTLNEYCFVKKEGNRVTRGCASTLEEQKSCLDSVDCTICQPSELDSCNNVEVIIDNEEQNNGSESGLDVSNPLICHQCNGINCLRTSFQAAQKCLSDFDICVTIFDGQTVIAQGCMEQISEELRRKCEFNTYAEMKECVKCNENMCNTLAASTFECIQCDSDINENCRSKPFSLQPTRCNISRTPNEYCFVKQNGKHVTRGCSSTSEDQRSCLTSPDCMICQPSELIACNAEEIITESGGAESGNEGNGNSSDNGGSGTNNGESGSGGSGGGSENTGNNGESGSSGSGSSGSGNEGSNNGSDNGSSGSGGSGNESGSGGGSESGNSGNGTENGGSGGSSESGESNNGSNNSCSVFLNSPIFVSYIIFIFFVLKYNLL